MGVSPTIQSCSWISGRCNAICNGWLRTIGWRLDGLDSVEIHGALREHRLQEIVKGQRIQGEAANAASPGKKEQIKSPRAISRPLSSAWPPNHVQWSPHHGRMRFYR